MKKSSLSLHFSSLVLIYTALTPVAADAQVVATPINGANTVVYTSPNSVPVVDIATPSAGGLSRNYFSNYNVDSRGLVLNNGDTTLAARQSQLAGQVVANLNLAPGGGASVILNEVVSTNRSVLAGFTEVLGKTADVMVANPNGITCDGCGFINTPNVTLTTGAPQVTNGIVAGVSVTTGDILVTGTGLNATNQDYLALVSRKIKFDGPVNANTLDVVAGANTWNTETRSVTATSNAGNNPDYAIDSTALGGMYANRIRLMATDAGVGVRLLGDVAASGGDFTINAAGRIQLKNRISATRDIAVATTSTLSNALALENASLTAQRNLALTALQGGAEITGSALVGIGNVNLTSQTLTDTRSEASLTDNNKRYAGGTLTLTQTGAVTINGTSWGAANGFTSHSDSFTVGNLGAYLYSSTALDMTTSTGPLILRAAYLRAVTGINLTANAGLISTEAGDEQGIEVTTGNLAVSAAHGFTNGGTLSANTGSVTLRAGSATAGQAITTSGTIFSNALLTIADFVGGRAQAFSNSGTIIGQTAGSILAKTITNTGNIQHSAGTTITADSLTNSGKLIVSTGAANSGTLTLDSLSNLAGGVVQSANNLQLDVRSSLTNNGTILAARDINVRANTAGDTLTVSNQSSGVFQATGALNFKGTTATDRNITLATQAGTLAANALEIVGSNFTNSGTLRAANTLTIGVEGNFTNSGNAIGIGAATVNATTLTNNGVIQSSGAANVGVSSITNHGSILGSVTTLITSSLTNGVEALVQASNNLTLRVKDVLNNSGRLLAGDDLIIRSTDAATTLAISNQAGGVMQAADLIDITDLSGGANLTFDTQAGTVLGDQLNLKLASFTNSGRTQSNHGAAQLSITGALTNAVGGTLLLGTGAGNANVTAASLTNRGAIQAEKDLTLTINDGITNHGTVLAKNALSVTTPTLTNNGVIQGSAGISTLAVTNTLTNSTTGTLLLGTGAANASIQATALVNEGAIQAEKDLTVTLTDRLENGGSILAKQELNVTTPALSNAGTLQGNLGTSLTGTGALSNSGRIIGAIDDSRNAVISFATIFNHALGVIQSAKNLTVTALSTLTNNGKLLVGGNLNIRGANAATTLALVNSDTGLIQASGSIDIRNSADSNKLTFAHQNGKILGNDITINTLSLRQSNTGAMQSERATTLQVEGDFFNDGVVYAKGALNLAANGFTNTAAGQIVSNEGGDIAIATTLTNNGSLIHAANTGYTGTLAAASITNALNSTVQAGGSLALRAATTITNAGQILTGENLSVRGTTASALTLNTSGRVQAGSLFSVKGLNDTNAANVATTSATGTLIGGTGDFNTTNFTLFNTTSLTTTGSMTLNTLNLIFGGSGSAIVGASTDSSATATFFVGSNYNNSGAIHSGGNLVFNAPNITNSNTGGFSALNNLTLNSNSAVTNNYGALYAGNDLTLNTTTTFTNFATTGTLDAGRDIIVNASTFINNNAINATRNITVNAPTFRNEISGGVPARRFIGVDIPNIFGGGTQRVPTAFDFRRTSTNDEGFFDDFIGTSRRYFTETYYELQEFATPIPTTRAQLIAGGTLTVNFTNGFNSASTISGRTVNLNGTGTFTNEDLALNRVDYRVTYETVRECTLGFCDEDTNVNRRTSSMTSVASRGAGAGIYANTLNAVGFNLVNITSPFNPTVDATSKTGTSLQSLADGTVSGVTAANTVTGAAGATGASDAEAAEANALSAGIATSSTTVNGVTTLAFGGLTITLPTNPNGFFVPAAANNSRFLIETNPRFSVGSNFVGSDFMARRLGFNPDDVQKRLGDANYEGYLVRQQLISQSGRNLLDSTETESAQMERLMTQGVDQSKSLGLTFGKPLTANQLSNLSQDIVWMVETEVKGQKVLAPVVYLSASTKKMFSSEGATISANTAKLDLKSVTNTGGTIEGRNSLEITSQNDVKNLSGTLKGGDVSIKSVTGSVINETVAQTTGTGTNIQTTIGKTAGIEATKNLTVDAKNDFTNRGANVTAGGNANLKAGNNITFDTIENRTVTSSRTSDNGLFSSSTTETVNSSTKQIGSGLSVGGNLAATAGNDLTIAGSDVAVGGNAKLDAGNDLNIIDRADVEETTTTSSASGFGKGGSGSIYGSEGSETRSFNSRSSGSSISVGGNLATTSGGDTNIIGSDIGADGDVDIDAKGDLNVLEGKNVSVTSTTTTSSGIGFLGTSAEGEDESETGSEAGTKNGAIGTKSTAEAKAEAKAEGEARLTLSRSTVENTTTRSVTGTASSIRSGGNQRLNAGGDLRVVGSDIDAGGNVDISAGGNQSFEAGENFTETTTSKSVAESGLYADGEANSEAQAKAKSSQGVTGSSNRAGASAEASTEGSAGVYVEKRDSSTREGSSTARVSTIRAGGNVTRSAGETLTDVGTDIEAGGNYSQTAKTIDNRAAENTTWSSSSDERNTGKLGGYAEANAETKAAANSGTLGSSAGASAEAGGSAGVKARYERETENESSSSSTAVTSRIKAGGNFNSTSQGSTTFEGTEIEAGKSANVKAGSLEFKAAEDTETSSASRDELGVEAKVGKGAGASASTTGGGEAEKGIAVKVKGEYEGEKESSRSSRAVTGGIKAGENLTISTDGDANFKGTNLEAGKDADIRSDNGSVSFTAARDTDSSSESSLEVEAEASLKKASGGSKTGGLEAEAGYEDEAQSSDRAVVGGVKAGGNLNVSARDNITAEGTNLEGGDGVNLTTTDGDVNIIAARDRSSESANKVDVAIGVEKTKDGQDRDQSGELDLSVSTERKKANDAKAGTISGGAGGVTINSGRNVNLEGTDISADGDVTVDAAGRVNQRDAVSTSSQTDVDVDVSLDSKNAGATDLDVQVLDEDDSSAQKTNISGSNVKVRSGAN